MATSIQVIFAATGALTLLDWGDSGVGHPLLDLPAFLEPIPRNAIDAVRAHWLQQWSEAVPGSDPARAAALLAPVAAARHAVIYRSFLDNIEPSEQPYHRADPATWLNRAATLVISAPPTTDARAAATRRRSAFEILENVARRARRVVDPDHLAVNHDRHGSEDANAGASGDRIEWRRRLVADAQAQHAVVLAVERLRHLLNLC